MPRRYVFTERDDPLGKNKKNKKKNTNETENNEPVKTFDIHDMPDN